MPSAAATTTATSTVTTKYARMGDAMYALCLLNTVAFCTSVIFFKDSHHFDSVWAKDGFCISNPTTMHWNSHHLCLYTDVVLASLFGILYFFLHKSDGMEAANEFVFYGIFGVIAHGLGHGGLADGLFDEEKNNDDNSIMSTIHTKESWAVVLNELFSSSNVGLLVFWIGLLKASMPKTPFKGIMVLSILSFFGNLSVAPSFAFTYVQTVLLLAFSLNQIVRPKEEKGFAYLMYGIIVSLPLGLVGWLESTHCQSFVIHYGGHLLYDAYIPLSMAAFYLICYHNKENDVVKISKKKIG